VNYFLCIGKAMCVLPRWLEPGAMTVAHTELGTGRFRFTLHLAHRRFGVLIHQEALFSDMK
jgi:hypothetical protein